MSRRRRRTVARANTAAGPLPLLAAPDELVVHRLEASGVEYAVFEWYAEGPPLPAELTRAEREVASLAMAGLTNRQIAAARGGAERTVANQLANVFRKLGVGSRLELTARKVPRTGR